ncbi:MAG: hypothetical protein ABMA00_15850 [Gemmatimonas sp.]
MDSTIVDWLNSVGAQAFKWSLGIFLVVNGAAAIAFFLSRDRAIVNRWTGRVLAIDLLLLGTGAGVPLMTSMASMTVSVISASFGQAAVGTTSLESSAAAELSRK